MGTVIDNPLARPEGPGWQLSRFNKGDRVYIETRQGKKHSGVIIDRWDSLSGRVFVLDLGAARPLEILSPDVAAIYELMDGGFIRVQLSSGSDIVGKPDDCRKALATMRAGVYAI